MGLIIAPYTGAFPDLNLIDLPKNLFYLCFDFIASLIIELPFYLEIDKKTAIIASAIANLSSYMILAIFVVYISVNSPNISSRTYKIISRNGATLPLYSINRVQQAFYFEHQRFASDLEELGYEGSGEIDQFYRFNISVDEEKAQATASPKIEELRKVGITDVTSATGIIFVLNKEKSEFISGVCVTETPSNIPPATPQLVDGEIQCPPGSDLR